MKTEKFKENKPKNVWLQKWHFKFYFEAPVFYQPLHAPQVLMTAMGDSYPR